MINKFLFFFGLCSLSSFLYAGIGTGPGGLSINFIENQGSTVTQRQIINFTGSGVTAVDNPTFSRTDVIISSGGGGGGLVVTGTPQVNYEVVWNGSGAVWAAEGTSFVFSIASFADNQSSLIEIGNGVWQVGGNINFTATYNNGPPIGSTITFSGWSPLPLSSPFTSTTSVQSVNFPSVGGTVVFTMTAQNATTTNSATITHTFDNRRFWGVTSNAGSLTSGDITGLAGNELSNSIPKTFTVNPGPGQYIVYSYPSRLGTATFSVGGFAGGFDPPQTISITNGSSFTENYSAYRSHNANLGTTTVVVTTP